MASRVAGFAGFFPTARRRIAYAMDESLDHCARITVNKGQPPTILWHCCGAESSDAGRLHRTAIGTSHSWHLWCERHHPVRVMGAGGGGGWEMRLLRYRLGYVRRSAMRARASRAIM